MYLKGTIEAYAELNRVCDFCGDRKPVCIYASTHTSMGAEVQCWRWCACAVCEELVDNHRWKLLKARIKRMLALRLAETGGPVSDALLTSTVNYIFNQFTPVEVSDE